VHILTITADYQSTRKIMDDISLLNEIKELVDTALREYLTPPCNALKLDQKSLLTEKEAAEYLGLAKGTMTAWRHMGKGPAYLRLGSAIRYSLSDLQDYIKINSIKMEVN
jgi:excisionase family DNA binding protein